MTTFLVGFTPYSNPLESIQTTIESRVLTRVIWADGNPKCGKGLMGFYSIPEDVIYICRKSHGHDYDEIIGTLKHEGWHAVQVKCNQKRALFSDVEIIEAIRQKDIKAVVHYPEIQKRLEAEARIVEMLDNHVFIRLVMARCK